MTRASLYWQTLRHLRPSQLAWQLVRRVAPLPPHRPVRAEPVRPGLAVLAFAPPVVPAVGPGDIAFLNQSRPLDPAAMDWAAGDRPKLWRYNLHYFDYLNWPVYPPASKDRLIDSWIAAHPVPAGDGWEPYPLSLRTVNWIRYWLTERAGDPLPESWRDSLATQLAGLETRLEYHLLANHLLKNGKALFFGGVYFNGPQATRWRELGLAILTREADEQILPDGGHFERSPMYHCIVLEDYLDVLNLARSNPGLVPEQAERVLASAAERACQFLAAITAGDGQIPLFNDAAFGIAPEPAELLAYGQRLGVAPEGAPTAAPTRIFLPDTGYFGYRDGGGSFIIDCGPVGPDYQPGHAHCDTLSYELCVDGQRVVVDTGVLDYEVGPTRQEVRGTAAHNTVQVDAAEQSEIWGAFRVARRARPLRAELGPWKGERLEFQGAHDGYRRLPGRLLHERRVAVERGRSWSVFDLISGTGSASHRAASYVHFGHDCTVEPLANGPGEPCRFILRQLGNDKLVMRLSVTCGSTARLAAGYTFPQFGVRRASQTLVIERQGVLPLEMHYKIERL